MSGASLERFLQAGGAGLLFARDGGRGERRAVWVGFEIDGELDRGLGRTSQVCMRSEGV